MLWPCMALRISDYISLQLYKMFAVQSVYLKLCSQIQFFRSSCHSHCFILGLPFPKFENHGKRGEHMPPWLPGVHGCNELNISVLQRAQMASAAWLVVPCCIREGRGRNDGNVPCLIILRIFFQWENIYSFVG